MKRTVLATVLLAIGIISYSQTTMTDYNFLTKGLKITLENGLEMKSNYNLQEVTSFKNEDTKLVLFNFYKTADQTQEPSALSLIAVREDGERVYLCLPLTTSDDEIISLCYNDLRQKLTKSELALIPFVFMRTAGTPTAE